jgi:guanylate kinase
VSRWRFAVTGPIGVGKDTVAAAIVARAERYWTRCHVKVGDLVIADLDQTLITGHPDGAAAARLAELRALLTSGSVRDFADVDARRRALQWWGAVRRAERPDYWLTRLDATLAAHDDAEILYVTDVRGRAEAELLNERGYLIVELTAPAELLDRRVADRDGVELSAVARRSDEWQQDADDRAHVDLVIANTATPEAAAAQIVAVLTGPRHVETGGNR